MSDFAFITHWRAFYPIAPNNLLTILKNNVWRLVNVPVDTVAATNKVMVGDDEMASGEA